MKLSRQSFRNTVIAALTFAFVATACNSSSTSDTCKDGEQTDDPKCVETKKDPAEPGAPEAGQITISDVTDTSLTVSWDAATDDVTLPAELEYKLVMAEDQGEIDSLEKLEALSQESLIFDFEAATTSKVVAELTPETTYSFAVVVKDGDEKLALYEPATATTLASTKPTVTLGKPSLTTLTSTQSATIKATFTNVASTSLSNGTSGLTVKGTDDSTCTATLSSVTTKGATITISDCAGDGTVTVKVNANTLTSSNGDKNQASAESSPITLDAKGPTLVSLTPEDGSQQDTIFYVVVTFSESMDALEAADFVLDATGCSGSPAPSVTSVTGSSNNTVWTAAISASGCENETLNVTINPAVLADEAGNAGTGTSVSRAYDVISMCLVGDSLVSTPTGTKPIREMKAGDQVLSFNFASRELEYATVLQRTTHMTTNFTTISQGGRQLRGAFKHRLVLETGASISFAAAGPDFAPMMEVAPAPEITYDLILDRNFNFYANGILVESLTPNDMVVAGRDAPKGKL